MWDVHTNFTICNEFSVSGMPLNELGHTSLNFSKFECCLPLALINDRRLYSQYMCYDNVEYFFIPAADKHTMASHIQNAIIGI